MSGFDPRRLLEAACDLGLLTPEKAAEAEDGYAQPGEARTFQRFLVEEGFLSERSLKSAAAALVEAEHPAAEPPSLLRQFVFSGILVMVVGITLAGVLFTRRPKMAPQVPIDGMLPVYEEGAAAPSVAAGGVVLTKLTGDSPLAREWNELVDQVVQQPGNDFKTQHLERARDLLARAVGTPHYASLKDDFNRMVARSSDRAGEAFAQTRAKAAALLEQERFADAWAEWELYPARLDERGLYAGLIPVEQSALLDKARRFAGRVLSRVDDHVARGNGAAARAELEDAVARLGAAAAPLAELRGRLSARLQEIK